MDIRHYFEPADYPASQKVIEKSGTSNDSSKNTAVSQLLPDFSKINVAIIGVPYDNGKVNADSAKSPDEIRKQLGRLVAPPGMGQIIDLGNLKPGKNRKANLLALRDVVEYLAEQNVVIVVLGGSQEFTVGICEAFKEERFFSLTVADAVLDVKKGVEKFNSSNFLSRVFKNNPQLFQFNLLGYQTHLVENRHFDKFSGVGHHFRLGKLREKLKEVEPVLRNTDVFSFDFGSVKFVEAPGNKQKNPNGLRSEEICQIAKYAGLSNKLKVFGLFDMIPDNDEFDLTSKLAAEIIWYFLEGVHNRTLDEDLSAENKKVFQVEVDQLDKPIVFYQDPKLNKWWYEIRSAKGERAILACSENEYLQASANEIPDLWLKFVQKIDEKPK